MLSPDIEELISALNVLIHAVNDRVDDYTAMTQATEDAIAVLGDRYEMTPLVGNWGEDDA